MSQPWLHGDPRDVVRTVLAQPAYKVAPTTNVAPQPSLLELVGKWFYGHVLSPLLHLMARMFAASGSTETLIAYLLIFLACSALGVVAFRLIVASAGPVMRRRSDVSSSPLETFIAAGTWRTHAREAAAHGDFARAIAALFSAALAALDERALVPFNAARTAGEYRRLVRRARLSAAGSFDELADRFVHAAYGSRLPDASAYEAAERAYAAFEPAIST